jgi:hypothetical protein
MLEVSGLLAFTSDGVETCLLPFAEEELGAAGSRGLSAWWLMTWVNKFCGGPRVPSSAKMMSYQILIPIDPAIVSCSKSLHRRTTLDASCLEIAGSIGILSRVPIFYPTI